MTAIMYIRQNSFGLRNDAHCCGLLVMQDSVCIDVYKRQGVTSPTGSFPRLVQDKSAPVASNWT